MPPNETDSAFPWFRQPMVWVAIGWIVGTVIGRHWGAPWLMLTVSAVALAIAGVAWARHRHPLCITAVTIASIGLAAGWWSLRMGRDALPDISELAGDSGRLADVEGVVEGEPFVRLVPSGELGPYAYQPAATSFVLRAQRWHGNDRSQAVDIGLLVRIGQVDDRLHAGDRIRCQGWLRSIPRPSNPGERDFGQTMRSRGVVARLSLVNRGNWQRLDHADGRQGSHRSWRQKLVMEVTWALRRDLPEETSAPTRALLEAVVLGRRDAALEETMTAFKRSGVAHLLSISGLHLGILAAGVWWIIQALTGRPRWAAVTALATVAVYLLIVPPRIAILRAGLMTILFCIALSTGRRVAGLSVLSAACVILLIWQPGNLFEPGFQLSFGVVAAILLFTPRVRQWMLSPRLLHGYTTGTMTIRRYGVDYLAVSVVAWMVAMPIVAYHFQLISPLAIGLTILLFPVIGVLLWIGFAKIALTLLWPPLGALLALPLVWSGEALGGAVQAAAGLPGAWFEVPAPSAAWALTVIAVVAALLSGWFARRYLALAACVALCAIWLLAPWIRPHLPAAASDTALRVNMFAVGNGSCYLVRTGGRALMFDCGSNNWPDITTAGVGPALRALGVRQVHTLLLSHPDMDHFSGAPELIDAFGVQRVLITEQFLQEAQRAPNTAAAHLIRHVRERSVELVIVARGWRQTWGTTQLEMIWPPPDIAFEHDNDSSLVLSVKAGGRRVLLCGDVQEQAMTQMLEMDIDLTADVIELPHHGSFVPPAPDWLSRVKPQVVLQSCGLSRLRDDPWPRYLTGIERYMTATDGMVELTIRQDGRLEAEKFRSHP